MHITSIDQIPKEEHFAIFSDDHVTIPGDERSRTSPGHGYPEHSVNFVSYDAYLDRAEFEHEVSLLMQMTPARKIRVAKITPMKVDINITVK